MPRTQFVDTDPSSPQLLLLKPRFVQAVEWAAVQLGPCADLLHSVTFSGYQSSKRSDSIAIGLELAYMFDGRTEAIVPVAGFNVRDDHLAFWHRVVAGIVGKTALAAHEIAHAHKRTGSSLHDLLASVHCTNGAVAQQFKCPKCSHNMRLFGNILICHQCGETKPC
jgi:hypothetical protein